MNCTSLKKVILNFPMTMILFWRTYFNRLEFGDVRFDSEVPCLFETCAICFEKCPVWLENGRRWHMSRILLIVGKTSSVEVPSSKYEVKVVADIGMDAVLNR